MDSRPGRTVVTAEICCTFLGELIDARRFVRPVYAFELYLTSFAMRTKQMNSSGWLNHGVPAQLQ